jgi:hypothetical protein
MAGGPLAGEEPGGSQNKGSRANRGHIAGAARLPPQKGENLFIFHERDLAGSAGDEKNVRLWAAGESVSRQDSQAVHIDDGIERFPDEMKVQFLEPCEYLEWPGEIELLKPGIKQHHDLHGDLVRHSPDNRECAKRVSWISCRHIGHSSYTDISRINRLLRLRLPRCRAGYIDASRARQCGVNYDQDAPLPWVWRERMTPERFKRALDRVAVEVPR